MKEQLRKRTVDYCIYVDEHIYTNNFDPEQIFDALYNIVYVLAIKHKLFKSWEDYEPFAMDCSCRLYQRLTNPKQFLPEGDPRKIKKIKSILNYIKKTLFLMKIDYQKEFFGQQFVPEMHDQSVQDIRERLVGSAHEQTKNFLHVDFEHYLKKISRTMKHFLKSTPYANNPVMLHNIYLSCLMTMLNQITLSNNNKKRLENKLKKGYETSDFINRVYMEEASTSTVLFHLDDSMFNYINTLVARIKKLIVKDLRDLIGSAEPTDTVVQAIIASSMEEYSDDPEQY